MSGIETRFRAGEDAERIRSAFYGFVERYGHEVDGDAHLRTEYDCEGSRVLVRLWSAEAMDAFLNVLSRPTQPRRRAAGE